MKKNQDLSGVLIKGTGYALVSFYSLLCIIPFFLIISASFSKENLLMKEGFSLVPRGFTTFAYKIVFEHPGQIIGAYVVTISITIIGTAIGLFIIAMTGYALQRPDFTYRNKISFYIYFTTLFSGGVVPFYLLMTKYLDLKDNYLAVLLPGLMTPFFIIMMKSFMRSIPHEITESAKMDGASDMTILVKLILPMSLPALATIGLFIAIGYWNEWYNSMLFLSANVKYRPLQLFLYNIISTEEYLRNSAASSNVPPQNIPLESMKMAIAVVTTLPVMLFYPFVQRYFIKGITVGAVKG